MSFDWNLNRDTKPPGMSGATLFASAQIIVVQFAIDLPVSPIVAIAQEARSPVQDWAANLGT